MRRGFTLIEMALSVAAIGLILAIGAPASVRFQTRNDLDIASYTLAQNARRAQALSRGMEGDSGWGVSLQTGSLTVYKGTSYAARDTAYDEVYAISASIVISGTTEYAFAKFSGVPAAAGSTTMTSVNNETRTIDVNAKGMVNY